MGYISALGIPIAGRMGGLGFHKGIVASKSQQNADKGGEMEAAWLGSSFGKAEESVIVGIRVNREGRTQEK